MLKAESAERRDSRLALVRPDGADLEIRAQLAWNRCRRPDVDAAPPTAQPAIACRPPTRDDPPPRSARMQPCPDASPHGAWPPPPSAWRSSLLAARPSSAAPDDPSRSPSPHRSPIALALSADGTRLLTANQTAGTVSLVDTRRGQGARRGRDRRQAGGRGALAGRHARGRHALVRLRPGRSSTSGPTGSRSPAGSRSAPSRAGW